MSPTVRISHPLLTTVLLLLVGCGHAIAQPPPFCAFLGDASLSTAQPEVRDRYVAAAAIEATACAGLKGEFYADVMSANSQASAVKPVHVALVPAQLRDNPIYDRAALQQLINQTKQEVADLVARARPAAGGSDMLGSLVDIGRVLSTAGPRATRYLVIGGDGLQSRAPFNLSASPLDSMSIDQLLNEIKAQKLLASLPGVKVYLVGLGVGPAGEQLEPQRLVALTEFWRAYFGAAGATVVSTDKVLLRFP